MSVYGIDLGTTYSCIAKLDSNGSPVIIQDQGNASDTLASAIYYMENGDAVVGEAAKESGIEDPSRLCQFFKRYIGREDLSLEDRDEFDRYIIDGTPKDPVELSSIILKKIVEYARDAGEDVHDVVITCPAYFNYAQREATRKAGELIGLNVLGIINEPTAAALNYSHERYGEDMTILVYDLGGGTFDVTLIRMKMVDGVQEIEVLATEGDDRLGGKDWDERVRDILIEKFCDATGYTKEDVSEDVLYSIRGQAEKAKQKLTTKTSNKVKVNCDGQAYSLEITREEFDARCADLLDKTLNLTMSALSKANVGKEMVDIVLLVGGSTSMMMVREMLKSEFGEDKVIFGKPNLAVAMGAALVAQNIQDGIDAELLRKLSEEIASGKVKITPTNSNSDSDGGSKVEVIPSTASDMTEEEQKRVEEIIKSKITAPQSGDDLISMISDLSDQAPKTKILDVAPSSFGIIVNRTDGSGGDNWIVDNILKIGDKVPFDTERGGYGTRFDNQTAVAIPVVMSRSENDVDFGIIRDPNTGSYIFPDNGYDMQELNRLVIPIDVPLRAGSPIKIGFKLNSLGEITLTATLEEIGKTDFIQFSFNKGYDEETSRKIRQNVQNTNVFDEF